MCFHETHYSACKHGQLCVMLAELLVWLQGQDDALHCQHGHLRAEGLCHQEAPAGALPRGLPHCLCISHYMPCFQHRSSYPRWCPRLGDIIPCVCCAWLRGVLVFVDS